MSVDTYKPEVWVANLLVALRKALVFGARANRDYEGEIAVQGDTVTVNSISRPTIGTYKPGETKIEPEKLTAAQRKLVITEAKYFAFSIDDVDKRQAAGGSIMADGLSEAGYGLADVFDQFIASLYTGVQSANNIGTVAAKASEPEAFYDNILVPLKVILDEANVPVEGRWCIIPPWAHGRLLRDLRFIDASKSGLAAASRTGFVGEGAGFELALSNNCPHPEGDDNIILAGNNNAMSAAEQINSTEAYRPQDGFEDALKGLQLYGAKLMRPDSIAVAQASQT